MSLLYSPHPFTKASKHLAVKELAANVESDRDYYVLLIGAILLATGAIFTDSIPVLIASMIVAPLAYPILGLGLGITARDKRLIFRSAFLLVVSCAIALTIASAITLFFGTDRVTNTFISFTGNRDVAIVVAVVAGMIAAYGTVRPRVASAITGVAIAVSLMPPLVDTGVAYVSGNHTQAFAAGTLFLLNVAGILVAAILVFAWFGMGKIYRTRDRSESDLPLPQIS